MPFYSSCAAKLRTSPKMNRKKTFLKNVPIFCCNLAATRRFAAIVTCPKSLSNWLAGRHVDNVENIEAQDLPVAEQAMVRFVAFQNLTI